MKLILIINFTSMYIITLISIFYIYILNVIKNKVKMYIFKYIFSQILNIIL